VEEHEAAAQARYRESESGMREHGQAAAEATLGKGLAGMYDARKLRIGNVVGQQGKTKDKDAAERQRITGQVNGIKDRTHEAVQNILTVMERVAIVTFDIGLMIAESAYATTFKKAKGGAWNWLTNWGSDWEKLIESSLDKAREEYLRQINVTYDTVADYVNRMLNAARLRVTQGLREVETFVNGLDTSVKKFGADALKEVGTDFNDMVSEIDQRRDNLIEKLTQQYKGSYERMSAMEE